jgi:hypothetical protein
MRNIKLGILDFGFWILDFGFWILAWKAFETIEF